MLQRLFFALGDVASLMMWMMRFGDKAIVSTPGDRIIVLEHRPVSWQGSTVDRIKGLSLCGAVTGGSE